MIRLALAAAGLTLALLSCAPAPRWPSLPRFHDARPEYALDGIRLAESGGNPNAVGDDGISIGAYQINETFHELRARAYGEYNPCSASGIGRSPPIARASGDSHA